MASQELYVVARQFVISGDIERIEPLGGGHIHDSHVLTCRNAGQPARFLLQRINDRVFPHPRLVMENIRRVTIHIRQRLQSLGVRDIGRRVLTLVPTCDGADYFRSATADFLTAAERARLVLGGLVITLEQGVRFLTAFLQSDKYYKTSRPGHNLDRCRTQLRLIESIEEKRATLEAVIARCCTT